MECQEVGEGYVMKIMRMMKSGSMRWAEYGEKRNTYRLFVGKPEGKRPIGRPRRGWVDVRIYLGEMGWGGVDRICWAQDRDQWRALVKAVMLRLPQNAGKYRSVCITADL
jgi:hypothetical protein